MSREQSEKLVKVLKSVLLAATKYGHARAAERAISELKTNGGSPGLDYAAECRDKQAGTGDKKEQYYSPLMYACENGMIDTVRILLQSGASPGYTSKERGSPRLNAFHVACVSGHLEVVQELLDATGSSHARRVHPKDAKTPKFGWTPVMYAIKSGHLEIVKLLGIDPNAITKQGGQNVLHIAARGSEDRHLECLKWLCSQVDSESLLATDKNGWNLLHHACAGGNVATVRWLVEQGPDAPYLDFLNQATKSNSGLTPLHTACNYQKLEVLKFLLDTERVDCCARTMKQGMTGLHFAAIHDSAEMARLLIEKNCPLHLQDEDGNTALHIAKRKWSLKVEEELNKADSADRSLSRIENKKGQTAAEIKPDIEVVIPQEIKKRKIVKEYIRALREGKERIPRCNLLILGEQEVGKTSLYRLISGLDFDSELESTKGIENKTIEVVDERKLSIDLWHEIGEEECRAKDEEAYTSGVAKEIGPLATRKEEKQPTEDELLLKIDHAVEDYMRSEDISGVHSITSTKSQLLISHAPAASLHIPQEQKHVPEASKQQPESKLMEPTHRSRYVMRVQGSGSPPTSPALRTEHERDSDREPNPPTNPPAEPEHPLDISHSSHCSIVKKMKCGRQELEPKLHFNTLDFAGQHEYRPMHHCFITGRAMYLVVFNLQDFVPGCKEVDKSRLREIRYWLHSINAHIILDEDAEDVRRVFLVGTHRSPSDGHQFSEDQLDEVSKYLKKELYHGDLNDRCVNHLHFIEVSPGRERIFAAVENSFDKKSPQWTNSGASVLQDALKQVTKKLPFLNSEHPVIWLRLEEKLLQLRQDMESSLIISIQEVLKFAEQYGLNTKAEGNRRVSKDVEAALTFFHDTGTIVYPPLLPSLFLSDGEMRYLSGFILLDPKHLLTVMRKVIKLSLVEYPEKKMRDLDSQGIAHSLLLKKCWKDVCKENNDLLHQLCLFLQAYGLIFPTKYPRRSSSVPADMNRMCSVLRSKSDGPTLQLSEYFLVPCRLPELKDVNIPPLDGITFCFDFQGFLPAEIFHRLICLMLSSYSSRLTDNYLTPIFSSTCCLFPNVDKCWWKIELELEANCLKIIVKPSRFKKEREPIKLLHYFHLEYLSAICQKSGLQGLVYNGGPRCKCGKVLYVVYSKEEEDKELPTSVQCDCGDEYTKDEINKLLHPEECWVRSTTVGRSSSTVDQELPSVAQPPVINVSAGTVVMPQGGSTIFTDQSLDDAQLKRLLSAPNLQTLTDHGSTSAVPDASPKDCPSKSTSASATTASPALESSLPQLPTSESIASDLLDGAQYEIPAPSAGGKQKEELPFIPVLPAESLNLPENHPEFIDAVDTIVCSCSGGIYHNPIHGVTLRIPEGAIPPEEDWTISVGVCLCGDFGFPTESVVPVSPIVWLCCSQKMNAVFLKPVEVVIPHFCVEKCNANMSFMKAGHWNPLIQFEQTEGHENFAVPKKGMLFTRHFCYICITSNIPIICDKLEYCITCALPQQISSGSRIYYYITYFNGTCLADMKLKFEEGHYIAEQRIFKFSNVSQGLPAVTGEYQCSEIESSSYVAKTLQPTKITQDNVNFWKLHQANKLKLMHENRLYPPYMKLTLGELPVTQETITMSFTGTQESDDQTDIKILIPSRGAVPDASPKDYPSKSSSASATTASPTLDLSTVTEYLLDLDKTQVYHLGISLGLSQKRAKNMFDSANNTTLFLDEIIDAWLQRVDQVDEKGGPSWKSLVAALRSKRLNQTGIANDIKKDHFV